MSGFYELVRTEDGLPLKAFVHSVNKLEMHWHKVLEILLVLKGSINLRIGKELYLLKENDIIVINGNETHNTSRTKEDNMVLALQIDQDYLAGLYPEICNIKFNCNSIVFKDEEVLNTIRCFLAKIVWELNKKREGYRLLVLSELNQLLAYMISSCDNIRIEDDKSDIMKEDMERLENIISYINDNLGQKITLQQLAKREHISLYYLSHFFKNKVGISFQEYINTVRLDKATSLLITTNDTITDVAFQCGFSSTTYFNKIFKESYNCTPTEYRDKTNILSSISEKVEEDKIKDKTYLDVDRSAAFRKLFSYLQLNVGEVQNSYKIGTLKEEICIDLGNKKGKSYTPYWKKLTTFGRAVEGLRADVQRQLRELQSEIGFEYVRFHGIFNDEMMIYNVDKHGNISYNWTYIDELFDFFMEIGIKPFIELNFMPSELKSSDETTVFFWKANISLPKDIRLWTNLVKEFVRHCINRYGFQEVSTWYFEVWNEPEYQYTFWVGTREDYFQLYKDTSLAIKSISPDLKVGGPAITHGTLLGSNWLDEFLTYCKSEDIPLDFVSIHIYPEYITQEIAEEVYQKFIENKPIPEMTEIRKIYHNEDHTMDTICQLNNIVDTKLDYRPEIHITEWNASSFLGNLIHDTAYISTFIVKNVLENMDKVNSLGYWVFTDIIEEEKLRASHFHGGFGLINKDGLKKASYYAYYLLNKLGRELVEQVNDYVITREDNDIQILAYNYVYFDDLFLSGDISALDKKDRYNIYRERPDKEIRIEVKGLSGRYKITRYELNRDYGSVFDKWVKIGAPENMSQEEIEYLNGISRPRMTVEYVDIDGEYRDKLYIPVHGVELIDLKKMI
ncbi:GH39 family glycosyl hydrolase [Tissierellaceae bacterium HCP3S3_D8]